VAALVVFHLMTFIARWRGTEPVSTDPDENPYESAEPGRLG